MTPECLAGAKANLKNLTEMQRGGLQVLKEDAMVSWIGKSMKNNNTGESRLLLGVTSLPAKSWIINVCIHQLFINISCMCCERNLPYSMSRIGHARKKSSKRTPINFLKGAATTQNIWRER